MAYKEHRYQKLSQSSVDFDEQPDIAPHGKQSQRSSPLQWRFQRLYHPSNRQSSQSATGNDPAFNAGCIEGIWGRSWLWEGPRSFVQENAGLLLVFLSQFFFAGAYFWFISISRNFEIWEQA
jgi:hypothetical protein